MLVHPGGKDADASTRGKCSNIWFESAVFGYPVVVLDALGEGMKAHLQSDVEGGRLAELAEKGMDAAIATLSRSGDKALGVRLDYLGYALELCVSADADVRIMNCRKALIAALGEDMGTFTTRRDKGRKLVLSPLVLGDAVGEVDARKREKVREVLFVYATKALVEMARLLSETFWHWEVGLLGQVVPGLGQSLRERAVLKATLDAGDSFDKGWVLLETTRQARS